MKKFEKSGKNGKREKSYKIDSLFLKDLKITLKITIVYIMEQINQTLLPPADLENQVRKFLRERRKQYRDTSERYKEYQREYQRKYQRELYQKKKAQRTAS